MLQSRITVQDCLSHKQVEAYQNLQSTLKEITRGYEVIGRERVLGVFDHNFNQVIGIKILYSAINNPSRKQTIEIRLDWEEKNSLYSYDVTIWDTEGNRIGKFHNRFQDLDPRPENKWWGLEA